MWNAETCQEICKLTGQRDVVKSVAISADGKRIVSGGGWWTISGLKSDRTELKVWFADTGQLIRDLKGHTGPVGCVAISADGQRIVSGGGGIGGQTVQLWDAYTGIPVVTWRGCGTDAVAISADGRRIVSMFGSARLLSVLEGPKVSSMPTSTSRDPFHLPVSPIKLSILGVLEGEEGRLVLELRGHTDEISSVAISADGKRIVSGS